MRNIYTGLLILLFTLAAPPGRAQAPVMGAASAFVLFSSTGAVGNTGAASHFTGNVGTSVGAITMGVNVNGVLHNADASAITANAAVLLLYNQIQGIVPTDTQLAIGSFILGNNDTLTAGVDSINVNTVLTDTLVLDGQANQNSVFIFKINGTLTSDNTLSPPAVVLINGALACNVFFHASGDIDMSPGTSMKGTLITSSSAINLGSGTSLEGRALTSTAGAITTTSTHAFLPTGCGSPILTGPTPPSLGAIACYALFTGVGSNTNSGITNVVGDVGSDLGLTTGYNALNVTGTIHSNPDLSTSAAAASLGTVSTYLNTLGLTPDIELEFPAQFGNDLVLTPHIYLLSAATPLTGNLFLDAEGNSAAVFVIKILGAMSTSVGANVVLLNGAEANNLYWIINGALSIANNAVMKGNFIVETGAVDIGSATTLDGRALTTNGAFTTDAITAAIPPFSCSVALPLTWLYFRGSPTTQGVALEWATTQANDAGYFVIEKSPDGSYFSQLASVNPTPNAGRPEDRYAATDPNPFPITYYRVVRSAPDGTKLYSQTIAVKADDARQPQRSVYMDGSSILLNYDSDIAGEVTLSLYGIDGRKVSSAAATLAPGARAYRMARPQQSGVYILYVESKSRRFFAGKVSCD